MSFEERMDRLTERHEALTQSLELLSHMHQDFEREHRAAHQKIDEAIANTQSQLKETGRHVELVARIALAHDQRITGLEGGRE